MGFPFWDDYFMQPCVLEAESKIYYLNMMAYFIEPFIYLMTGTNFVISSFKRTNHYSFAASGGNPNSFSSPISLSNFPISGPKISAQVSIKGARQQYSISLVAESAFEKLFLDDLFMHWVIFHYHPNMALPPTHITLWIMRVILLQDAEGLKETGMFYGVEPVCLEGVAHDMMLDSSWEKGAEAILSWLKNLN